MDSGSQGVFPNHYAGVAAKAGVGRVLLGRYASQVGRQASLVQYGLLSDDGSVSWAAGDRKLLGLALAALARYSTRRDKRAPNTAKVTATSTWSHTCRPSCQRRGHGPGYDHGAQCSRNTSTGHDGGGAKLRPTSGSAVMRVRSNQLGLGRLDYLGSYSIHAIDAVATTWQTCFTWA